ncbi:putative flagellum biosynthesis repressor protein FlbT 1 [Alsobacter metallidurans]|uniref:Flagellum biosynthesis repressor protein FlbT 1 n=1 Tax=Alsobacter metallidurans TaxID=340221 RepID=A0A917I954_9HYPH|nr:flagellar biosynthesis repressor FlbT [Alsobacter metallidurans]GGH26556.1 putative flagellum biosynthesis repressor protein FlbT 1 [Alsobacter metallidurans]
MALKVELKPNERIIIGNVVLRNADARIRFFIEGHAPILREKDILTAETADTPAKKIYLAVQLMYLDQDTARYHDAYFQLVRDFLSAAPSALPLVAEINNLILSGDIYKALKASKKLIDYEAELLSHAVRG